MGRIGKKSDKKGVRIAVLAAVIVVLLCSCDPMELKNYITTRTFGTIYVSDTTGSDSNPGTMAEPMKSIDAAIDYLKDNSVRGRVNVAVGTYNYEYSAGDFIQVVEGISLYGGFSVDFGSRDVDLHETIIVDTSASGGTFEDPNRPIDVPPGVTPETVIDGFTIQGGGGSVSAAVFCYQSSPTVSNNRINGGTGTSRSFGVFSYSSDTVVIDNREINGGSSSSVSIAVNNYSGSQAHVENNYIHGGSGTGTAGIINESYAAPTIIANTIHGGVASNQSNGIQNNRSSSKIWNNTIFGGQSSNFSIGIACFFAGNAEMYNNTIDGGSGTGNSIAIYLSDGLEAPYSTPTPNISNNILFTTSSGYGIYEYNRDGLTPSAIDYNDIWDKDGNTVMYYRIVVSDSTDAYDTVALLNALDWADGNVSLNPHFASINGDDGLFYEVLDNDWHLTASADSSVREGALDLANIFKTDKDGKNRTGNGATLWSMGAYEY
jgi:hypothetical protein